ncbi:hypothetical protein BGZ70_009057 [Mortierella alpina]|uniref:F-box domain-containing protein n=1 Tax=Mortierella alpina TaxID=64518 RepID=A0A9P6M154_MORAP|nr:hypothetical protein BGZ70_009057 [Mortierella alpina]
MSSCDPLRVPEILRLVLSHRRILQPIDLASTSLVSKTWYLYSSEALWQEVELDGESLTDLRYEDLFRQLTKYGHYTRTLVLKECDSDRPRFNALLPTMPNLQAILVDRAMLYNRASPTVLLSLEQYSTFSSLRYLNLPFISNSGSGIESLLRICASAYGARHLDLVDSEIDDAALAAIARSCPKLKSLDLSRNEMISFRGFLSPASPGANPNLERWAQGKGPSAYAQGGATNDPFSNGAVSSDSESAPNSSPCLQQQQQQHQQQQQYTSLHGRYQLQHRVSDHTQQHPARSTLLEADVPFMHLEELSLVFCFGIANTEFQTLFRSFQHKSLRSLNLQFTNIEDSALETLARSLHPPTFSHGDVCGGLNNLNLNYCNKITARGIKALVEGCPQLRELEFLSCDLVSAECFRGQQPWACTKLRRLEFTLHPRVLFTRHQQENVQANPQESERLSDGGEEEEGERESAEVHGQESTESGETPSQAVHLDPLQLQSKILSPEFSQPEEQHQGQMDTSYMYIVPPLQHQQRQQQEQQQLLLLLNPQKKPQGNDEQEYQNTSIMRTTHKKDLWSYEQESVQSDYHAMFKQLKRLKDLRSLHIYNSPALNSSVNPGDPYQEGAAAPWMPDGAFFFASSTMDTTAAPSSEVSREVSLSDGASLDSTSFLGFQGADEGRGSNGVNRGEENNQSQEMYLQEEPSSDFREQGNISGSNSSTSSSSNHEDRSTLSVRPMQASSTGTAIVAEVPSPVHPFSLRTGLKALERLTQLESLTLYERSNIPFGSAEARWISKAFPQLSLLQLRGAIEISDTVLGRLTAKRPHLKVQVCSLFE